MKATFPVLTTSRKSRLRDAAARRSSTKCSGDARWTQVEIVQMKSLEGADLIERHRVDSCRAATALAQCFTEVGVGTTDIEHTRARCNSVQSQRVGALEIELGGVGTSARARSTAVELSIVEDRKLLSPRLQARHHRILRVHDSVHMRDFVAVIGWDRNLANAQPREQQLNDDLRIEVKSAAVQTERNPPQGVG
jgi:hypothetical protein